MAKFGEIINSEKIVLICFHLGYDAATENTLKDIITVFKDKFKIVKIDILKNKVLAENLYINNTITYIIYKEGEMRWREEGEKNTLQLVTQLQPFV